MSDFASAPANNVWYFLSSFQFNSSLCLSSFSYWTLLVVALTFHSQCSWFTLGLAALPRLLPASPVGFNGQRRAVTHFSAITEDYVAKKPKLKIQGMCGIWMWMVSAAFSSDFDLLNGVLSIENQTRCWHIKSLPPYPHLVKRTLRNRLQLSKSREGKWRSHSCPAKQGLHSCNVWKEQNDR